MPQGCLCPCSVCFLWSIFIFRRSNPAWCKKQRTWLWGLNLSLRNGVVLGRSFGSEVPLFPHLETLDSRAYFRTLLWGNKFMQVKLAGYQPCSRWSATMYVPFPFTPHRVNRNTCICYYVLNSYNCLHARYRIMCCTSIFSFNSRNNQVRELFSFPIYWGWTWGSGWYKSGPGTQVF